MAVYVVVIGPPGAGKGTQAIKLSETLQITHVSTGELFRGNIRDGTELGKRVDAVLSRGELVSDELTIALVRDRLEQLDCERGAVMDGFPRTAAQAQALDEILDDDGDCVMLAPYIHVTDKVIIERLTGRRVDARTGETYHVKYNPPPLGLEVEQRLDDCQETVQTRINEYHKNTASMLAHYTDRGVLQEFDGEQPINVLTDQLLAALEDHRSR